MTRHISAQQHVFIDGVEITHLVHSVEVSMSVGALTEVVLRMFCQPALIGGAIHLYTGTPASAPRTDRPRGITIREAP